MAKCSTPRKSYGIIQVTVPPEVQRGSLQLLQSHRGANAGQPCTSRAAPKCNRTATDNPGTDADDDNFTASDSTDSDASDNDSDIDMMEISDEEVAEMLPSKTVPEVNNRKKPVCTEAKSQSVGCCWTEEKGRACSVKVEEIEDKDSARKIAARNNGISSASSLRSRVQNRGLAGT